MPERRSRRFFLVNFMANKVKIYKNGLEENPKGRILFGNLIMLLWFALGTLACWYFYPLVAWFYLAFAIVMVYIVLRKLVCMNCYYYDRWCGLGWGKLSALMFKKGKIEDFNKSIGLKIAPLTYGILMIIPAVLIIISIIQMFIIYKLGVLIFLLLISFYSGVIRRKKTCGMCKMRLCCPGSAVK